MEVEMAKILVVDDVPELRSQLKWAAEGTGREIFEADSGKQAIKLIQEHNFDVIVTDLKMETETAGLDVLKAAKEKDILTQVIVITAYGTPAVSVDAMRLGAFDYLERSAPGTEPLEMIRRKIPLALDYRVAKQKEMRVR
jgi:DNA-binding NtrC family response regulator